VQSLEFKFQSHQKKKKYSVAKFLYYTWRGAMFLHLLILLKVDYDILKMYAINPKATTKKIKSYI
jgi:hypothetical protein